MPRPVTPPPARDISRLRRLVPLAVGISILAVAGLIAYGSLRRDEDLGAAFATLDWRLLPVALGLHIVAHLFWAARYSLIAGGFGLAIPARTAWRIVTAGVFGGAVTPGRIGGEGVKMAILMRGGISGTQASRLLLADRSVDLVFFLVLGIVAASLLPTIFGASATTTRLFALGGVAMLMLFVVLLAWLLAAPRAVAGAAHAVSALWQRVWRRGPPQWRERFEALVHDVRRGLATLHKEQPARIAAAYILTALNWLAEYAVLWVLLQGFGHDVPYWQVFFVGVVLTLVANIPITPGGSGVAEVAGLALLSPLAPGLTTAFVIAWRGLTYYYDLVVGGVFASIMLPRRGRVAGSTRAAP